MSDNNGCVGQFGTVDSATFLINEILKPLKKAEAILALVGIVVGGRLAWKFTRHAIRAFDLFVLRQGFRSRNENWTVKYGKWAVINGAAKGIGLEVATQLAQKGMNIILIRCGKDDIFWKNAQAEIGGVGNVKVIVVSCQFCDAQKRMSPMDVDAWTGKEIGILVNNIVPDRSNVPKCMGKSKSDFEELLGHDGVLAMSHLQTLFIPEMFIRKRGAVINISATEEFGEFITPETRYLDVFAQNFERRFAGAGLVSLNLSPYGIRYDRKKASFLEELFNPQPKRYVRSALRLLGGTSSSTGYWPHGLQYAVQSIVPVLIRRMAWDIFQRGGRLLSRRAN